MKDIKKLNKGNFTRNNWQLKKLGDVCDIVKDMPKEFSGEKKYFSTGAVGNDYLDLPDNVTYKNRPSRANIYPKIGDIGFAKMKFTNKVLLINSDLNGSIFSTGFCFLRPSILLDSKYLFHFIISDEFQKIKDDYAGDGIMGGIKNSNIINIEIPIPSLSEQKRITKLLDDTFKKLEKVKENTEKNLQNSKELFKSYLNKIFSNSEKDWEERTLKELCISLFAGGDVPKGNFSKIKNEKFSIPIYANGIENKGLYGYTNIEKVKDISITISARGTIGYSEIRNETFYPIVRLIVAIPNTNIIDPVFLYYITKNFKFSNTGSSIPQLTIPMVKDIKISYPKSLNEQKIIVKKIDQLSEKTKKLEEIYKNKIENIEELKKSILNKAFSGEL